MFSEHNFEVVQGAEVRAGSLVQMKGGWFLCVGDSAFLLLSGNSRGLIFNLPNEYLLLLRKQGRVEIRFLDAIKATSVAPHNAGPGTIVAFTDNGLRFVGNFEGEHKRLFTVDGEEVQETPRIGAHDFALYVQLIAGGEAKII
ncbi:TPA: hypothetical protein ACXNQL_000627 [Stenotrophomonas maltophilia]